MKVRERRGDGVSIQNELLQAMNSSLILGGVATFIIWLISWIKIKTQTGEISLNQNKRHMFE